MLASTPLALSVPTVVVTSVLVFLMLASTPALAVSASGTLSVVTSWADFSVSMSRRRLVFFKDVIQKKKINK
jgi:hypothetical protein